MSDERKFTRVYDEQDYTDTWVYDLDIFSNGPIECKTVYKNGFDKSWEKRQKTAIQMRVIQKREKRKQREKNK